MRLFTTILLIFLFSFTAMTDDHQTELTILHMNDIHSHLLPYPYAEGQAQFGGIANAAGLIESIRAANPNTLVLNAGDLLVGDFMYAAAYDPPDAPVVGYAEFFIQNMMGFDAFVLGNHEFDVGPDLLYAVLSHGNIQNNLPPILCANFQNLEDHAGLASIVRPDTIIERGGLQIGIIGFVTEETNLIASPHPLVVDTLWHGDPTQPETLAPKSQYQDMIDGLRARGADIVIALTHLGHQREYLLSQLYTGIDIIIGGHSHSTIQTVLEGPLGNQIPYARAGAYTEHVAEMTVTIENNQVTDYQYALHDIYDAQLSDPQIGGAVQNFQQMVEAKWPGVYNDVVADIPAYMDGRGDIDGNIDKAETNLGNLITDAMRDKLETDIAIEAAGVVRQSLMEGDATPADIYRVLSLGFHPIRNEVGMRLVYANVPAFALVGALDFAVESRGTNFFFQVSGLSFEFDSSAPPGEKLDVQSIRINGEPVNFAATYTVALNEYIAGFGIALGFVSEDDLTPTEFVQYEVVRDFIATADMSQYEDTQGRIVDTADPVSVPISDAIPTSIELKQNYPNPFNPSTTIRYHLNKQSFVTLDVYNILGQKVTTLVNDELQAGIHQVEFNSNNIQGQSLPSGVYIYRLTIVDDEIGSISKVRRMVLMK